MVIETVTTKYHRQQKLTFLTILKARTPRSKFYLVWLLLRSSPWHVHGHLLRVFANGPILLIFPKIANHVHYQLHVFKFIFLCIAIIIFHHILQFPPSFCLYFIFTNRINFQGDKDHYHFIYSYVPNLKQFLEYNRCLIFI